MTSIRLTVNGANASAMVTGKLTSGMVGVPVTIEYDRAWDELAEIPGTEVRTSEVYARYRCWCDDNGIPQESNRDFNASLRRIATVARKRPKSGGGMTTLLIGYQLRPRTSDEN